MSSFISSFKNGGTYPLRKGHVAVFLVSLIATLLGLELINRHYIYTKSDFFLTQRDFERKKDRVEVVFLGDSHFKDGLDQQVLGPRTFNLSFRGADYIRSYYILRHYIDQMPALKLVVLPADIHSWSSFRTEHDQSPIFWGQFVDYDELKDVARIKFGWTVFNLTLMDDALGRKNLFRNFANVILVRMGQERFAFAQEDLRPLDVEKTRRRVKYHFEGREVFDPVELTYFEKILQLCSEHQCKVVTLQMPISRSYAEFAKAYVTWEDIQKNVVENPRYGNYILKNLNFLDHYTGEDRVFSSEGDHLNPASRGKFTKAVLEKIPGWLDEAMAGPMGK